MGRVSRIKWPNKRGKTLCRFSRKRCGGCSVASECIKDQSYKNVCVGPYYHEFWAAMECGRAEPHLENRETRAGMGAKFAECRRYHGMGKAVCCGQVKVGFQALMTGIATNVKRIITLLHKSRVKQRGLAFAVIE